MLTTTKFVCLYLAAGLLFLLGVYLVRRSINVNSNSGRAHMLAYDDHALWQANSYSADFLSLSQASNQSLNENPQSGSQSINQDPSKSGNIPSGGAAPSAKSYMLTFRIPEQLTMSTIHPVSQFSKRLEFHWCGTVCL